MTIIRIGNPIATAVKVAVSTVASTGTITRFSPEDHMHQGVNSAGMSNIGNTSGTTGVGPGRLVFAGGDNITLSQSTNATGSTLTISAAAGGLPIATAVKVAVSTVASTGTITRYSPEDHMHQGINSAGMSSQGNTIGTSGVGPGRLVFAGGNNITLSQVTDATGSTLGISAFNQTVPTVSYVMNFQAANAATSHGTMLITPMLDSANIFPGNMTVSTLVASVSASHTNTSASTEGQTYKFHIGIYTVSGSSTLNMLYWASTTFGGAANSDMSSKYHGPRWLTLNSSQFSDSASNATTPSFSFGGQYFLGYLMLSSGTNVPLSIRGANANAGVQGSGTIGTSIATATSLKNYPFWGILSVTTATPPVSIHGSDMNGTSQMRPLFIQLENRLSAF